MDEKWDVMFLGEYRHSIDAKGRLIVPSKFRESLGQTFVMTKGLDGCLFMFPLNEWEIFENRLRQLPFSNKSARTFVRFFTAGASESSIDKNGRTLVPQNLRKYADLEKDVVIIGTPNRIEIWDESTWEEYIGDDNLSYEDIAEQMEELGF